MRPPSPLRTRCDRDRLLAASVGDRARCDDCCSWGPDGGGLHVLGKERVEIHCDEANVRSAAVARRLGYRLDRLEDRPITAPGEHGRHMIWVTPADDRRGLRKVSTPCWTPCALYSSSAGSSSTRRNAGWHASPMSTTCGGSPPAGCRAGCSATSTGRPRTSGRCAPTPTRSPPTLPAAGPARRVGDRPVGDDSRPPVTAADRARPDRVHPHRRPAGELAVARAASGPDSPYTLSTMATRSIEEVAERQRPRSPRGSRSTSGATAAWSRT